MPFQSLNPATGELVASFALHTAAEVEARVAAAMRAAAQWAATPLSDRAATLNGLQRQVQTGGGPVQTLLTDTTAARQLRHTVSNVAQSTAKLNQSMTALQHNFLLRGYFRKQAKKKAHAAADSLARVGQAR